MQARAVGKKRFVDQDKRPVWQGGLHAVESRPLGGAPLVSIGGEQVERLAHAREEIRRKGVVERLHVSAPTRVVDKVTCLDGV